MTNCPKVLVISHNCFSKVYNNGKTLEAIFSSFDKNSLSQLFFVSDNTIDYSYCSNYFQITDIAVLKTLLTFRLCGCGSELSSNSMEIVKRETATHKSLNKYLKSNSLVYLIRDLLWQYGFWKTKRLTDWCRNTSPDVIFFVGGGSTFSHNVALYISNLLSKPLVTYFTDDYLLLYSRRKKYIERIQHYRISKCYQKTIERSSLAYVIGTLMAKEYSSIFNKPFFPIMNLVDINPYIPYVKKDSIKVSYFGGLHLDRWRMLVRLAELFNGFENVFFSVYTVEDLSDDVRLAFEQANIHCGGTIIGASLRDAMLDSDVLLHVESDNDCYKSLTKLSISTKIPEYLNSGRFILGYGPIDIASFRILIDNNIGAVISSSLSNSDIINLLEDIINNYEYRRSVGLRGYNYSIEHFDKLKVSNEVKNNIESICLKTKSY